jgi:UDP-glucose 4-epimerase
VLPLRFFNVYGPRQMPGHSYAAVIPVFVAAALKGTPLPVHGDGQQSRDFTFVETVIEVLTRAVLHRVTAGPTNLAFGTRTDLNSVIALVEEVLGRRVQVDRLPARPGDVRHSQADNTRLRSLFPEITPTPLVEGLAQTIEWMEAYLAVRSGVSV